MTIQYASDLHLEFRENSQYLHDNPLIPTGDILILAGDIAHLSARYFEHNFFDYVSEKFQQVYWIRE